ncbi:hypothetical protein IEQ34_010621 [Dendrobium chrysotoxum]|uniref:Uncharacterized protein n=1 Tax=Dendrobium chrysotoxum TaxID=161865 RepID=A0AAV7GWA3_DENCH|nr:hypothetical protein IEQ34_010621 [Dendrobium chrysotoxum]
MLFAKEMLYVFHLQTNRYWFNVICKRDAICIPPANESLIKLQILTNSKAFDSFKFPLHFGTPHSGHCLIMLRPYVRTHGAASADYYSISLTNYDEEEEEGEDNH